MNVQPLLENGQFLAMSRQQPELFFQPIQFTLKNETQVTITSAGVIQFIPNNEYQRSIVLSCGVHGNETAPIEICDDLVQDILCDRLALRQPLLVLFANLPAMDIAERFVEENMNRLFSGAHSQETQGIKSNIERLRAAELEQSVVDFYQAANSSEKWHLDLHTAIRESKNEKFAVYPFLHGQPWSQQALSLLLACGINTILLSNAPTTTFSYFSSHQCGANAFTVELGKVKPFGGNDMYDFQQLIDTLRTWLCQPVIELKDFNEDDFEIFKIHQIINRQQTDFKLNFADDTPNFSDFPVGYVLAEESSTQYIVTEKGESIVFPNAKVALGQRALLTVVPTKIDENII